MWKLVQQFSLLDARRTLSIIQGRLETIQKLKDAIEHGAKEIPDIHNMISGDSWLLDPRWDVLDDEVTPKKLGIVYEPEVDDATGQRMDFLFVLQPSKPAPIDQVVVVEIKRGSIGSGRFDERMMPRSSDSIPT